MTRYDIAMDFISKFVKRNENVWKNSIKPTFFSINGDEIKKSNIPNSWEEADLGLVLFHYTYTVLTQEDKCIVPLFSLSNGEIEDYVEVDGWNFSFSKPKTALYRCNGEINCYMSNNNLGLVVKSNLWSLDDDFEKIWQLFSIVRTCTTQKEIDFAYKIFKSEKEILSLKCKNLCNEVKIDSLNTLLDAHKDLIEKIKEMTGVKSE